MTATLQALGVEADSPWRACRAVPGLCGDPTNVFIIVTPQPALFALAFCDVRECHTFQMGAFPEGSQFHQSL